MDPARLSRYLAPLRIVLYVLIFSLVGVFVWRYEVFQLPEDRCSPVGALHPGDRLLVDLHPWGVAPGDTVFFQAEDGQLALGLVSDPPPSAPAEVWEACAAGALWIVGDRADCPVRDSRVLGPIDPEAIAGRIAFVLPW